MHGVKVTKKLLHKNLNVDTYTVELDKELLENPINFLLKTINKISGTIPDCKSLLVK